MASRPSAQYGPDGLVAFDTEGSLRLTFREDKSGPFGQPSSYWHADRATVGPVSIKFTANPALVRNETLPGPAFDIRNATGGLTGSMWALVPAPNPLANDDYNMTVSWNISKSQGAAFTWAHGIGPHSHSFTGPISRLLQSFFIVGNVTAQPRMPAGADERFGMYWFDQQRPSPPFDISKTALFVKNLLDISTKFWQDTSDEPYRVFIRYDRERPGGSGGTALPRAFTIGYNVKNGSGNDSVETLLAHEMTQNWTPWVGDTAVEQSRYNEGAAEYWSLKLLWRAGLLSTPEYLKEMNQRVTAYYTNPAVNMTDQQAQDSAWEFRPAQTIPYGRGMIHFLNMDAQIRSQSGGIKSLDNLAIDFVKTCRSLRACGSKEWFPMVKGILGQAGIDEWNPVSTGKPLIKPRNDSLGPFFEVLKVKSFPEVYNWQVKTGVNISSPACLN